MSRITGIVANSRTASSNRNRHRALAVLTVMVLILAACGNTTVDTTTTAAAGETTTTGAEAGTTTEATAASEPKVLRIVAERALAEPAGMLTRLGGMKMYTDLAGDVLIERDYTTGELKPMLATSWEQVEPNRWRFALRDDVVFHNGEPFNAEAVAWNIAIQTAEDSPSRVARYATSVVGEVVDEFTVDLVCPEACPILDIVSPQFMFTAPAYAQENPDEAALLPMGTGPFKVEEFREGEFLRYTAFEDYWGDTGYFDEVIIMQREEPGVRAAMVATGEADLTERLGIEDVDQVPQVYNPESFDGFLLRFRERDATGGPDPLWGDVRFRQALAHAIDCQGMADTLMQGTATCVNNPFHPSTVGYVADLPKYDYDPVRARELLDEVVGEGVEVNEGVHIVARVGDIPALWAETIMSYWEDIGVNATFEFVEGDRRNELHDPGVDGMPPDVYVFPGHSNDLLDASITLTYMDGCNQSRAYSVCDQEFADALAEAETLSGDERRAAMEALMRDYFYPEALLIPMWPTPTVFGASANLEWDSPHQEWIRPDRMRFTDG